METPLSVWYNIRDNLPIPQPNPSDVSKAASLLHIKRFLHYEAVAALCYVRSLA